MPRAIIVTATSPAAAPAASSSAPAAKQKPPSSSAASEPPPKKPKLSEKAYLRQYFKEQASSRAESKSLERAYLEKVWKERRLKERQEREHKQKQQAFNLYREPMGSRCSNRLREKRDKDVNAVNVLMSFTGGGGVDSTSGGSIANAAASGSVATQKEAAAAEAENDANAVEEWLKQQSMDDRSWYYPDHKGVMQVREDVACLLWNLYYILCVWYIASMSCSSPT